MIDFSYSDPIANASSKEGNTLDNQNITPLTEEQSSTPMISGQTQTATDVEILEKQNKEQEPKKSRKRKRITKPKQKSTQVI